MVPPADAERIALAASDGQIMLALRNPLDADLTRTLGIRTAGLLGNAPAPIAPRAVASPAVRRPVAVIAAGPVGPPAPSRPRMVETYKAGKRGTEVVQ
jgi:Flp pilus assembly protein CpaB